MREVRTSVLVTLVGAMCLFGFVPSAYAIPIGWACIGSCGTLGANGVVTAPPGGATYDYVTTNDGVALAAQDLNLGSETNGTTLTSVAFAANAGDPLAFYFNFVTSDGAGFADYGWAACTMPVLGTKWRFFSPRERRRVLTLRLVSECLPTARR